METVLRVAFIYLVLLISFRVLGKREFSQMSPLELVTLLLVPELVSQALTHGDYSITNAIIAVMTLFSLVIIMSILTHLSPRAEKVLLGEPVVMAADGNLIPDNMNKERISPSEIETALRQHGITDIKRVRYVVLETDGRFSVVPVDDTQASQSGND